MYYFLQTKMGEIENLHTLLTLSFNLPPNIYLLFLEPYFGFIKYLVLKVIE